jgi:hypothetical protein
MWLRKRFVCVSIGLAPTRKIVSAVAVVQLVHAHVAARVDLGVVGRPVVNPAVLHLHRSEVELAGAPGVLVAARAAAVVEHGDVEVVLVILVDHPSGHPRDEVERVVPCRGLPGSVAPDERICEALLLGARHVGAAVLGHAGAAHGAEPAVHDAVGVRLDDEMHGPPVLAHHVVHRGRIPVVGLNPLLDRQVFARPVVGEGPLLVHRPTVGLVAATDDAIVAGDVVDGGIGRNDRQPVDLSLESHLILPQTDRTLDRRP